MQSKNKITVSCLTCGVKNSVHTVSYEKFNKGRYCNWQCWINRKHKSALARFWSNVQKDDGCWLWQAGTSRGYGFLNILGKNVYAHRMSYEIHKGEIPTGMCVLHKCDTPACVNPEHLLIGTHQDNMTDRSKKGRTAQNFGVGEQHYCSKLMNRDIPVIRDMCRTHTHVSVAQQFNVTRQVVDSIIKGETWKHI
jgi:hypothetical protein